VISLHKQPAICLVLAVSLCSAFAGAQESEVERNSEAGQQALASGNYPAAEQAYEKLAQLEPSIAEIHANLGLIYFQEGRFDSAIAPLQRALKLKPTLTKSSALLAMSLSEVGRYEEALPGLERCFRALAQPEMKRLCGLHLERAYTGLQQDRRAVSTGLELDRLYPSDPEVRYNNGRIFGNFAFLLMQRLGQVAPNSVWKHQTLAEADEAQGSYDAAISEYRQALALDIAQAGKAFI
jgi:tetratricopeptide (TPR) repeat protein